MEHYFIELIDLSGRIIRGIDGVGSLNLYSIDISDVKSGVYYLRISDNNQESIFYEKVCVL